VINCFLQLCVFVLSFYLHSAKQLEDDLNIEKEKRITKSSEPTPEDQMRKRIEKIIAKSIPQTTPTPVVS
jgi:hypothetical protein